jgi:hypothetical protein
LNCTDERWYTTKKQTTNKQKESNPTMKPTTRRTRRSRQEPTYTFLFERKKYLVHADYNGKAAQFVIPEESRILHVHQWIMGVEFTAVADRIETFDPTKQSPEELAKQPNVFLAELVQQPEEKPQEA